LAGIRQFSATVAGGWLPVKEPVADTGLGIAGKRQVAGGQVADICPSHTQPGPSQHFGDPPTFQRSASRFFFNWGDLLDLITEDTILELENLTLKHSSELFSLRYYSTFLLSLGSKKLRP